ncbi:hypothetical protein TNCV_371811 [Trichonephila clavipes]|nr:hypothetical protein TNCV_371811 [Trichonephila clavipes]
MPGLMTKYLLDFESQSMETLPPGQKIGVTVPSINQRAASKHDSHASQIPSFDQSPSFHSAEWKTPLSPCPVS